MTQTEALDILKLGYNVFLTGAAGSGKTYLLNQYIEYLKSHKVSVGITASTGIAATHMGGTTIHSWAGMGIKDEMTDRELLELFRRQYIRMRFIHTKVLIIDEISMLHAHRLDLVHRILRIFHRNSEPFGGIQVIMCGDFFQLPPVTKQGAKVHHKGTNFIEVSQSSIGAQREIFEPLNLGTSEPSSDFVTESEIWGNMNLKICYLDEQHRQDDRSFLRVLNDIRSNEVNEDTFELLSERIGKDTEGYTKPTRLFTHNTDVDAINKTHLEALQAEEKQYSMSWRGSLGITESLRKSCLAPEQLVLKVGAQVMFVKNNYEAGYVNGTLGEVIAFSKEGSPIVRTFDGAEILVTPASWEVREENVELAAISQLPLRLAWAITVHKSQGMSLDAAEVDLSRSFIPGMGYVALSRVRSLKGLKLMGMNQMALSVNPEVLEMDRNFIAQSNEITNYLYNLEKEKKEAMQEAFLGMLTKK